MTQKEREAFGKKIQKASMKKLDELFYDFRHSSTEEKGMSEDDMAWVLETIQAEYHRRGTIITKLWTIGMTEEKMIEHYTKEYQNLLSSAAEQRMADLEAEAAARGLRFRMTNEAQYRMPHYTGAPRFELVKA